MYNYLKNNEREISPYKSFIYGGIAATVSWVSIYPQDRIKTHIQIENIDIFLSWMQQKKYIKKMD